MINIPKGTKDMLPGEAYKWSYVKGVCRDFAALYNLKEISTPVFEHTELFLRGVGDTTDVVNKEMYTFEDKGGRSITLKPEGTAGVARAFIENGLKNETMPQKMFYFTPVFRYERPQAGRLREHHQFGIELYGGNGADLDAEVIAIAYSILHKLGLSVELNINSMGCKECRNEYNNALKEYYRQYFDKLCPTCRERLNKNPSRLLDCKDPSCAEFKANAPKMIDYLCDDCREHFETLKRYLDLIGINYKVNPYVVRGLDYYTRTVFEFITTALGAQGTVCGGGRYDGLIEQLGGQSTPAVGFGMGIERVIMLMETENAPFKKDDDVKLFIVTMDDKAKDKAFEIVYKLRCCGIKAEMEHAGRGVKAQFKYADKINAENIIVLGENELQTGICKLKNKKENTEKEISIDEIAENIM